MALSNNELIKVTEKHVRSIFENEGSGHDWWHIHRVRSMALKLAQAEGADLFLVELAALLHDIDDYKLTNHSQPNKNTIEWLNACQVDQKLILIICNIIEGVSFKGAQVDTSTSNQECKVLQDADRLDAMGAIGIARTFAYGGSRSRALYDPAIAPISHDSFKSYQTSSAPTINHFYEKLLLLKDLMQTNTGKRLAEKRHEFMLNYLDQFYAEWDS
jgi:uncharacterized protein